MLTFDSIVILSKNEIEKQVQELISIGLTRHRHYFFQFTSLAS